MEENESKNEGDVTLPKACMDRLFQTALPKATKLSKEAREFFKDLGIKFIQIITVAAHKICENESKKTIVPDHIFKALEELGFIEYVDECKKTLTDYLELSKRRPSKKNTFEESGLTMEELLEKQKKLFEEAKKEMDKTLEDESLSEE
ncbi:class 2 transcription repressor NC2 subunit [Tubulinosema ratisbonensis]|uniref:Class 2 transcription repressor NC2 subunit n=1 Tax=Tubulinosema ratisbonensis TaxID=291195 RepID=A0A437ANA1_9MICR|nr:class 2 transcription repressor NC2 subunit [Tubulinosema ratisbonensis]